MHKKFSTNTLFLVIIVVLFVMLLFKNTTNYVVAQGDGNARHVFGVLGEGQGNRQPFFLVDTTEQTILVYEYFQGGGLGFVAARNYQFDKKLQEYGKNYGLAIENVKEILSKETTR
ncbi:conserved hypothetical protein [Candidatus Brocadia pituitae]|nr:conserved hypothetical protein [Candidatus Brocadia pituitae]